MENKCFETVSDVARDILLNWSPTSKFSQMSLDNIGLVAGNGGCRKFARQLIEKVIAEEIAPLEDITVIEWVSNGGDYGHQYLHVMVKVYDMLYDPFYHEGIRLTSDEHERDVLNNLFAVYAHRLKISTGLDNALKVEGKLAYMPTGSKPHREWDEIYIEAEDFISLS